MVNVQVDTGLRDTARGLNSMVRELNSTVMVLPKLIKMFERLTVVGMGLASVSGASGVSKFSGTGARLFARGTFERTRDEGGRFNGGAWMGAGMLTRFGTGGKILAAIGGGSLALGTGMTAFALAMVAATVAANNWTKTMVAQMQKTSSDSSLDAAIFRGDANAARERANRARAAYDAMNPETPSGGNPMSWSGANWAGRNIRYAWNGNAEQRLNREDKLKLAALEKEAAGRAAHVFDGMGERRMSFGGFEESWNRMASQLGSKDAQTISKQQLKALLDIKEALLADRNKIIYGVDDSGEVVKK
jgi:hypothetical protein